MNLKATRYEPYTGITGHVVFAALTCMALRFWQERTLILDAAFQSYLFIATGEPAVMVERFGAVAVQLLPLAGVWAGASLKTVLMLYSVSFVLFHWTLFSVCLHGLKDKKAALAILLFNILFVGDAFYWIQNELLQAVSLMFVLWSLWLRRGDWKRLSRRETGLSLLLAATVAYYHPLVFFPLAFTWLFFWFRPGYMANKAMANDAMAIKDTASRPFLLAVAALFALIFSSKYLFRQPNFYDRGMTGQYVREFNFSPENLLESRSLRDFLTHLNDNFLLLLPLWIFVTGFYLRKKRLWEAMLVSGSILFYCLLVMQRFLHDDRWYIQESHYQALAVFLIVPLVCDIFPAGLTDSGSMGFRSGDSKSSKRLFFAVIALLIFRLGNIWSTHHSYTARLAYVRSLLDKTKPFKNRKLVIGEDQADRKTLMMYWGLPYETFQLSSLESPDSLRVIAVSEKPDSLATILSRDSMVTFLMIPPLAFRDLPPAYYQMRDTSCWRKIVLPAVH